MKRTTFRTGGSGHLEDWGRIQKANCQGAMAQQKAGYAATVNSRQGFGNREAGCRSKAKGDSRIIY